jgi:hypothetical protein
LLLDLAKSEVDGGPHELHPRGGEHGKKTEKNLDEKVHNLQDSMNDSAM